MGDIRTVLETSTERPSKGRRRSPISGTGFAALDQSSTGINGKVNNRANSSSDMFYHFIYATFRGFSTSVHLHRLYSFRTIIFRFARSEDVDRLEQH